MSLTGIGEVATLATSIVNKIWPDKSEQEKNALAFQIQQMTMESDLVKGQLAINANEASNNSIFVAGWRPFIGWSCGSAFAWTFVIGPFVSYIAHLMGSSVNLPTLDLSQLSPVLMGMLGLGAMRTVEKVNGIKAGN